MIIKVNYQFSKSAVGFFSFFSSTNVETKNVCPIAYNVLRLCVCLPLAQSFKLPQILMGQIAQNRCYA